MVNLITNLIGGILTNSNDDMFRIIEIQNSGTIVLKDMSNKVISTDLKSVVDYKLNLTLECA